MRKIEIVECLEHVKTARGANSERTQVLQAAKHGLSFEPTPHGIVVTKLAANDAFALVPWSNVKLLGLEAEAAAPGKR